MDNLFRGNSCLACIIGCSRSRAQLANVRVWLLGCFCCNSNVWFAYKSEDALAYLGYFFGAFITVYSYKGWDTWYEIFFVSGTLWVCSILFAGLILLVQPKKFSIGKK